MTEQHHSGEIIRHDGGKALLGHYATALIAEWWRAVAMLLIVLWLWSLNASRLTTLENAVKRLESQSPIRGK